MATVKIGFSLALRYLVSVLMSFVIFLSFVAIFTMPLTEAVGYDAFITEEATGQSRKVYTHYYTDGEDTQKAQYEAQGHRVYTVELRSEMGGIGAVLVFTAAQLTSLCAFIALVPSRLYRLGEQDSAAGNACSTKRWLIPTAFPAAISLAGYVLLLLNKLQWISNQGLTLYRYAHYHLYGLLRLLLGTGNDGTQLGWLPVGLAVLPTALTVLVCGLLYHWGYRNFHPLLALKNRIKYKRNA